ncbi:MAG: CopG family transcriptional regulator [Gaiella sp.]
MRRLQLLMDEDLDDALERKAREEGTSKAALVRQYVGDRLRPLPQLEDDPLLTFMGSVEGGEDDSASIDEIVYGPRGGT